MDARLAYHMNKSLGIMFGEILEYLDLVTVREDVFYQSDALVRGNGRVDQPSPGGRFTGRGNTISS